VDRHHRVFDDLLRCCAEDDGAASDHLRLVAHWRNGSDVLASWQLRKTQPDLDGVRNPWVRGLLYVIVARW